MGAPGDLRSPKGYGARLAPEQKRGLRGFDPPGQQTSSAQEGTGPKHGSGVLIKIPSSILIGWGLPNIT